MLCAFALLLWCKDNTGENVGLNTIRSSKLKQGYCATTLHGYDALFAELPTEVNARTETNKYHKRWKKIMNTLTNTSM